MSRIRNIVRSVTEPSSDNLWFKDNKLYSFRGNGWEEVEGKVDKNYLDKNLKTINNESLLGQGDIKTVGQKYINEDGTEGGEIFNSYSEAKTITLHTGDKYTFTIIPSEVPPLLVESDFRMKGFEFCKGSVELYNFLKPIKDAGYPENIKYELICKADGETIVRGFNPKPTILEISKSIYDHDGIETDLIGMSRSEYVSYDSIEFQLTVGQDTTFRVFSNEASGDNSHAEGYYTSASNTASHSKGKYTLASGVVSYAEGQGTEARGNYSHVEGLYNKAFGSCSHVEGGDKERVYNQPSPVINTVVQNVINNGDGTVSLTILKGKEYIYNSLCNHINLDHNFPFQINSKGSTFHIGKPSKINYGEGQEIILTVQSTSLPLKQPISGFMFINFGPISDIKGKNITEALRSHVGGEGSYASENSENSFVHGTGCIALNPNQTIIGTYNYLYGPGIDFRHSEDTAPYLFSIGNGTNESTRSNAFSVKGTGETFMAGQIYNPQADYAEMFEWQDGNINDEDRVGYFVTMKDDKIVKATSKDKYILGIVSASPAIVGDNPNLWHGQYLNDEWGRPIYEDIEVKYTDYETNENGELVEVEKTRTNHVRKTNPEWDTTKPYINRTERKEWDAIGLMGKLLVRQDGTLTVGSFCKSNNEGIATASTEGYYVMKVNNKNQALVMFK